MNCRCTQVLLILFATLSLLATSNGSTVSVRFTPIVHSTLAVGTGPTDYATIQEAVDAAADGDVITVAPGTYAGFSVMLKSVSIIGSGPSTLISSNIQVYPSGAQKIIVQGMTVAWGRRINVVGGNGGGLAILQDLVTAGGLVYIDGLGGVAVNPLDVRVLSCTFTGQSVTGFISTWPLPSFASGGEAMWVWGGAHVELVNSVLYGGDGTDCLGADMEGAGVVQSVTTQGGRGGVALVVFECPTYVHLSGCRLFGGRGGSLLGLTNHGPLLEALGGAGGAGLVLGESLLFPNVIGGGNLLITGSAPHVIWGGSSGAGQNGQAPPMGSLLTSPGSQMRISGVTVGPGADVRGPVELFPPGSDADPHLAMFGTPTMGQSSSFLVSGPANASSGALVLGRAYRTRNPASATLAMQNGMIPIRTYAWPSASSLAFNFGSILPLGKDIVAQAVFHYPDGTTRYSNTIPIVSR